MTAYRTDKTKGRKNKKYVEDVVRNWRKKMTQEKLNIHQLSKVIGVSDTSIRRLFEEYGI